MHVGTGPVGNEFVGVKGFRRLMKLYPSLKVNVPHMGQFEVDEIFDVLAEYPGVMLDTAFTFAPNGFNRYSYSNEKLLRYQDRIVYGSDFPNLVFDWDAEINELKDLGLEQDFYRNVFYENAMRLLQK